MSVTVQRGRDALARCRLTRPDVVTLALLASPARQIEPELLRALRLAFAPRFPGASRPSVGTEGALWFSRLVESRGPDSITLLPEVCQELREELRQQGLVEACVAIIKRAHLQAPPVIVWEEELVQLGLSADSQAPDTQRRLELLALQATKAISGGSREGLERWIEDMWPRLPLNARAVPELGRLRTRVEARRRAPSGVDPRDGQARLETLLDQPGLRVGFLGGQGDYEFAAPSARSIVLELEDAAGQRQVVAVREGEAVELAGWKYPLRIGTRDGRAYRLEALAVAPPPATDALAHFAGHVLPVWCVALTPDGAQILTGEGDGTVRVWDSGTHELLRVEPPEETGLAVLALVAAGGARVAGFQGGRQRVWREGGTLSVRAHSADVNALVLLEDGQHVISGSDDGTAVLWDSLTGSVVTRFEAGAPVLDLAAGGSSMSVVVAACGDGPVRVWDRAVVGQMPSLLPCEAGARSVALALDAKQVAVGAFDGSILWLDLRTGNILQRLEGHTGPVYRVALTRDGRRLVSVSADQTLRVWDTSTWQCESIRHADVELVGLALSADGTRAVSGGNGTRAFLWDLLPSSFAETPAQPESHQLARVALLGNRGVGKTWLAARLAGGLLQSVNSTEVLGTTELKLAPASSGTERRVLLFESSRVEYALLDMLLGRTAQLVLVAVDLSDPRALEQAADWLSRVEQHQTSLPARIAVAMRSDATEPRVSADEIQRALRNHQLAAFVSVSGKTGSGLEELRRAMSDAIRWHELPTMTNPSAFSALRAALPSLSDQRPLVPVPELVEHLQSSDAAQLNALLPQLEREGSVFHIASTNSLLLRPSVLDEYALAIVEAARSEPHGLAFVASASVLDATRPFRAAHDLSAAEQSALLHEIIERMKASPACLAVVDGLLVFPEFFPARPLERVPTLNIRFAFSGAPRNVFVALVVELSLREELSKIDLWANAARFRLSSGEIVGLVVRDAQPQGGEIGIFREHSAAYAASEHFAPLVEQLLSQYASGATRLPSEHVDDEERERKGAPAAPGVVFVSYARHDDSHGFVRELVSQLQEQVYMVSGSQALQILMERDVEANRPIEETMNQLQAASALLVVESPGYVQSEWCREELRQFLEGPQARPIFKVVKFPVPSHQEPDALREFFGYQFFRIGTNTGAPMEFEPQSPEFRNGVNDIAHRMASKLMPIV